MSGKCIFNSDDSVNTVIDTVNDVLSSIDDLNDTKNILHKIKESLKQVVDIDANTSMNSITDTGINTTLLVLVDWGINIEPDTLYLVLYNNESNSDEYTNDEFDIVISRVEGDSTSSQKYDVWQKYGSAMDIYMRMKLKLHIDFVLHSLFNLDSNKAVRGNDSFNLGLQTLQEKLFNDIKNYILIEGSEVLKKAIKNARLYESGMYTGNFENLFSIIQEILIPKNGITGNYLLRKLNSIFSDGKSYIDAYNAFVILQHFDLLLYETFGKNLTINHNLGNFTGELNKYSLSARNNLPSNWRTNDDIDAELEIDKITSLIVSTFPIYLTLNTKQEGNYMTMLLFIYITSKVRGLDRQVTDNINFLEKDKYGKYVYLKYFKDFDFNYLKANNIKTLSQLLNKIDDKPSKHWGLVFTFLANYVGNNKKLNGELYPQDKSFIYSIYNSIYSSKNSLKSIYTSDIKENNYFSFLVQAQTSISGMEYIRYTVSEAGVVIDKTLHKAGGDVFKNYFERSLNAKYSKKTELYHKLLQTSKYVTYSDGVIEYWLDRYIKVKYNPQTKSLTLYVADMDGEFEQVDIVNDPTLILAYEEDIKQLLLDVLGITLDNLFFETYIALHGAKDAGYYTLLLFASDIISNDYFVHEFKILEDNGQSTDIYLDKDTLDRATNIFYGSERLSSLIFRPSSGEYGVFIKDYFSIFNNISLALSIVEGRTSKGTVKDAEGNDLGVASMSRLYTNLPNLYENECSSLYSAVNECSLITKKYVKKTLISREYKGEDGSKTSSGFNANESYHISLLYDFFEKLHSGEILVLPCVVADKSMILKALVDFNKLKKVFLLNDASKIDELSSKFLKSRKFKSIYSESKNDGESEELFAKRYTIENLPEVKLEDINSQLVWDTVKEEFGKIYSKIVDSIDYDWLKLNNFIGLHPTLYPGLEFDPLSNFEKFNLYIKDNNLKASKVLEDVLRMYLNTTNDTNLVIRLETHYVNVDNQFYFNSTLVSMLYRFYPEYKNIDYTKWKNVKFTNFLLFIYNREESLLHDLLNNKFEIDLLSSTLPKSTSLFKKLKEWVDESVQKAYIGEITIRTLTGELITLKVRNLRLKEQLISKGAIVEVKLNPMIALHNAVTYFVGQEYIMTSMGISAINPAKSHSKKYGTDLVIFDLAEESERFTMSTKRNVTLTGNMNRYIMDLIYGLPTDVDVAYIDDPVVSMYNLMGDIGRSKILDGATFTVGPVCYLQNNSLQGASAGIDLKPLWHAYHSDIASASIIKTASFGLTNERSRKSEFVKNLNRKGLDILWDAFHDITEDFNKNPINIGNIYYKDSMGLFKCRNNVQFDSINHTYSYSEYEVDDEGNILSDTKKLIKGVKITSNYLVYQLLGGDRSCSIVEGKLKLSEASMQKLADIICLVGHKKSGVNIAQNASDVILPLKEKMIYYHITAGAIKKGVGNINSVDAYTSDDPLLRSRISMKMSGIQLDKTHEADGAHLSIMTLVINALCARGYTGPQAAEVYKALLKVTQTIIHEELAAYLSLLEGDSRAILNVVGLIIIAELSKNSSDENSMAQAVVNLFIDAYNKGANLGNLQMKLPISDPGVFNKFVSTIASTISKMAIKMKFDGVLAVLNPSHGIYKIFGGKMLDAFNNVKEIWDELLAAFDRPLDSSRLNIGTKYYKLLKDELGNIIINGNLSENIIEINSPQDYWNERKNTDDSVVYVEAIAGRQLVENPVIGELYLTDDNLLITYSESYINTPVYRIIPIGRDLATYNVYFKVGGKLYSMWDLAIVKHMYDLDEISEAKCRSIYKTDKNTAKATLRRNLQLLLHAISSKDNNVEVTIYTEEGEKVLEGIPENVEILEYENILPLMYKSKFGLDSEDDVYTISKLGSEGLSEYFINKIVSKLKTLTTKNNYDLELKQLDGKHVYILHSDNYDPKLSTLKPSKTLIITENDKLWFVDYKGNKIKLASSIDDKIYLDVNNVEVILTKNILFYLEHSDYYDINISSIIDYDTFNHISEVINNLDEETAEQIKSKYTDPNTKQFSYDRIIDSELLDENYYRSLKWVQNKAKAMHTSFLMSLYTLAARIPSQSMLSFMGMKTVGYDTTGINSVYVNAYLIWLLGSDFDIDTVSMLGYSFSRSGKFKHWTPYADYTSIDHLKAFTRFPFPTNEVLESISTTHSEQPLVVDEAIKYLLSIKDLIKRKQFDSVDTINKFIKCFVILNDSVSDGSLTVSLDIDEESEQFIKNLFNKHNSFLLNKRNSDIEDITKNFISASMFDIINNPVNLILALSPIDKAVDAIKDIGNNSPKAFDKTRNTPGNAYNIGIELFNNMAGKEVTGISAAGLKGLLGITHATNQALNNDEPHFVDFYININNEIYTIAANAYTTNPRLKATLDMYTANQEDAVLVLSAILSLATDNAKELQLSKINATEELVSMYIAGITIGMDFRSIYDILTSEVAEELLSKMHGNILTGDLGMARLDKAISYVERGPFFFGKEIQKSLESIRRAIIKALSDNVDKSTLDSLLELYVYALKDGEIVLDDEGNPKYKNAYAGDVLSLIGHPDIIWTDKLSKDLMNYLSQDMTTVEELRFSELLLDWVDLKVLINTPNGSKEFKHIRTLYEIGAEITNVTTSYGINLGLKTNKEEIIHFRHTLEGIFTNKYRYSSNPVLLDRYLQTPVDINTIKSLELKDLLLKISEGEELQYKHIYSAVSLLSKASFKKYGLYKHSDYAVCLTGILNDSEYRNKIFELYNVIKKAINVPYVTYTNQHYNGYIQAFDVLHHSLLASSYKYRELNSSGLKVIDKYGIYDRNEKKIATKKAEKFFDTHVINLWLRTQGIITVPAGTVIVDEQFKEFTTTAPTDIQLGSPSGNMSFKMYFEQKIIPDLKKGIIGENIIKYTGNSVINDLSFDLLDNTVNKNAISVLALPIDMLPKNSADSIRLEAYKSAFAKLSSLSYYNIPVLNLLWYYNLIVHGNSVNSKSMLMLFKDLKIGGTFDPINDYYNFIAEVDSGTSSIVGYDMDELERELAPVKNVFRDYSRNLIIGKDPSKLEYEVMKWLGWYSTQTTETGEREQVRNRIPYTSYGVKLLLSLSAPSEFTILDTHNLNQNIMVSPKISIVVRYDEDKNLLLKTVKYNGIDIKIGKYIEMYNAIHDLLYQINDPIDLLMLETKNGKLTVNTQLTSESIERMINDPCK